MLDHNPIPPWWPMKPECARMQCREFERVAAADPRHSLCYMNTDPVRH